MKALPVLGPLRVVSLWCHVRSHVREGALAAERVGMGDWITALFTHTPLRIVVRDFRANHTTGQSEYIGLPEIISSEDERLFPVFTDQRLADDFLVKGGIPEMKVFAFDKTNEFGKFLRELRGIEYDGIIFDPGTEYADRILIYKLDLALRILDELEAEDRG